MKIFLVIYFMLIILVMGILTLDRYISYEPKSKFGKWWRKHIVDRNEEYD